MGDLWGCHILLDIFTCEFFIFSAFIAQFTCPTSLLILFFILYISKKINTYYCDVKMKRKNSRRNKK